jgi:hypothetical protein
VTVGSLSCDRGYGKLYFASPYVAASAIAGKIVEPFEFLGACEPELVNA